MAAVEYRITYEQCKRALHGVCSRCGGELDPLETKDNSGNPTFWPGCKECCCFDYGVTPETYRIAKELVEVEHFHPYSHIDHDHTDDEATKQYKIQSQISNVCGIVNDVLRIHNAK